MPVDSSGYGKQSDTSASDDPLSQMAAELDEETKRTVDQLNGIDSSYENARAYLTRAINAAAQQLPNSTLASKFVGYYLKRIKELTRDSDAWGYQDYCRATGCGVYVPLIGNVSTWSSEAAGSNIAGSMWRYVTSPQNLGQSEAVGHKVKAAVYETYKNKTRAAQERMLAGTKGGNVTAAQTVSQAKANAGRPPSAAEEAAAQRAAQEPALIGWPGRYWPPAIGVELAFGASSRPTPNGGSDFAQDGTWGRALLRLDGNKYVYDLNEKYNFALFGLNRAKLAQVNAGLKDALLAEAGNTDGQLQRDTWYRLARERLLKAGVPSGQIAAVYGVGPGLPADTQPEPDALPPTPAGTYAATLQQAQPGWKWWHYVLAGVAAVVVIGGVVYVVRK